MYSRIVRMLYVRARKSNVAKLINAQRGTKYRHQIYFQRDEVVSRKNRFGCRKITSSADDGFLWQFDKLQKMYVWRLFLGYFIKGKIKVYSSRNSE